MKKELASSVCTIPMLGFFARRLDESFQGLVLDV